VFNDDEGHYLEVIREMKRRGVCVPWTAFFKPEGLDDETVKLMRETGLRSAEIGADGSTDTTLRKLGKSFLFKDVVDCNELLGKNEVATSNFFMFGCPGETQATVLEGIANIRRMENTVSFIYMGLRILPQTPLARIAQRDGLLSRHDKLLEPIYYIAPGIDKGWLEQTLSEGFTGLRRCVFPGDRLDSSLQFLHKLGYTGFLSHMLIGENAKGRRRSRRHRKQ
jgi:radical SAM superfamily enzyme YgiQ (UPF0313 family)